MPKRKTAAPDTTTAPYRGFTIVELLIVIVVIGILAAVTLVAYGSMQQRARAAAAQAAGAQAQKKLNLYKVETGGYPTDLATAGVKSDSQTSFQYTYSNSGTTPTFCVTATVGSSSYRTTESASPTNGGCPGHGQGGVAAVTNLEPNPSFEAAPMTGAGSGSSSRTLSAEQKISGSYSTKFVWGSGAHGVQTSVITVSPSTTYYISLYVYVASGASPSFNVAASDYTVNSQFVGTTSATGSWQRITKEYTTASNQTTLRAWTTVSGASTFYVDAVMISQGSSLYDFADGDSPNWVWNGPANSSSSTGPAI